MFPGAKYEDAVRAIYAGAGEPIYGQASHAEIQVCPQNLGELTPDACEALAAKFPETRFRLHANARVLDRHHILDASTFSDETRPYYEALADRSRRLGAKAYTLHAGYAANCDLATMIDNMRRVQDIFGDIAVGVEGLYPSASCPQLMDTWAAYEQVLRSSLNLAVDLSHLKIVAHKQGNKDFGLVEELVSTSQTIEIHVSDNNGSQDRHERIEVEPWWWPMLYKAGPNAVVFSESNQYRKTTRQKMAERRAGGIAAMA